MEEAREVKSGSYQLAERKCSVFHKPQGNRNNTAQISSAN